MNLFFHHVGKRGASEDFDKTVFSQVQIKTVKENIPEDLPIRAPILEMLHSVFPEGNFNCWGVPSGAKSVIRNLSVGDGVLLVETTAGEGNIPVLAVVKAYWNFELRSLSQALWGNHKFPFIFFFKTQKIDLTWIDFMEQVGYKLNFRPSGQFYRVNHERLVDHNGVAGYLRYLLATSTTKLGEPKQIREKELEYLLDKNDPIEDLKLFESTYAFLEQTEKEAVIKSRIGQGRFRKLLLKYWGACAVTGCQFTNILRASHIKPWKYASNEECLDSFNGLLLVPNLDIAFDSGLISFTQNGEILISQHIDETSVKLLGIDEDMKLRTVDERHKKYLQYHRENRFLK